MPSSMGSASRCIYFCVLGGALNNLDLCKLRFIIEKLLEQIIIKKLKLALQVTRPSYEP